jgi:hypothetical protein
MSTRIYPPLSKATAMACKSVEPSLSEALSDPVIRAVMKADGVDPALLAADLRRLASSLRRPAAGQIETI